MKRRRLETGVAAFFCPFVLLSRSLRFAGVDL
jgi:hypothetical protein